MGVQNLWDLLAPVGRRVSVETLAGKKLAIDASIWMVQFVKAMRDEKGEMVRNAHILGFFRRICKLLFLRTKPVFVFDGGTPALKRRTVAARRRHRENARAKIRKTAEKLLLNHLKAKKLEELASELKNISKQNVDAKGKNVLVDDENGKVSGSDTRGTDGSVIGATDQEKIDEMLATSLAAEEAKLAGHEPPPSSSMNAEEDGDDDEEEIMFPVIHGNVDPTVLASLPPSMQLDLLIQMRERLMAENRQKYQKINKMPTQFSQLQIESYLKTVSFRREIDEVQKNAAGKGLGGVQTSRIASEANREFIFSSSFAGDKQILAAGRVLNNEQTKSGPLDLASKKPSFSQTKLISQEGFDEHLQKFRADDATCCAEKDSLRVNRVSGLGTHMTRDLQRNLNLMKEHEHGHKYKESLGVAAPKSIKGNDVIISIGDEPLRFESNIVDGEILKISFSGDGCEEISTDTVDDFFSRLVAGSSSSTFPSENPLEGISDQSESNIAWEEGMLEERSENEQNNIQMDPQISHVNNMASEDDEVDWEEGVHVDLTTNTSCETENQRIVSRGNLEEEADVQEAIRRSLEDLGKEQLKVFNNKILTVEEAYRNTSLLIPKNSSPKGSQSPSAGKGLGQLDHYIVENLSSPEKQLSSSIMRDHNYDLHLPVVDKQYPEMSVSVEAKNFCSHPNEMHRKGNLEKGLTEKQGAIIPENIVSKELPQHGSNRLDMDSVMELPKAAEITMVNLDHLAEPLEAQINRNDLQFEREMPQSTMGELEKGVVAEEPYTSFVQEISHLRQESERIGVEQRKLETIAELVSSEMFTECQELLQMFGLPYIIAPMEAEAQCAYMEIVNLVDGVVTDDSDVFLFGARSVYKNIFDDRKYVETYFMKDIETELGLTREKLIRMALLLGSDYTEGVSGIGIVNAIEVVNAFPEDDGLQKFREWIESPDPSILGKIDPHLRSVSKNSSGVTGFDKEAHGNNSKDLPSVDTSFCRTGGQTMIDDISDEKRIFMNKHRNISKNWHIPPSFPSDSVISAYTSPQVDESIEPFSWGKPDLSFLRKLCWEKFGWSTQKADELLVPVLKEYNKHETQLRLEAFYSFNERFAKIRSKRIKRAVKGITGKLPAELADDDLPKGETKSPTTCNCQVDLNEYEGKTHSEGTILKQPKRNEPTAMLSDETHRELLNENRNQQRSRGARGKGRLQGKRKPGSKASQKLNFDTMELDSGANDDATMQTPEVTEVMHGTRRSARKKTRPNYAEVRLGGDTLDDPSEDLIDATAEKTVADNDGMAGETHEIEAKRSVQIDNCLPMDVSLGEGFSLGKSYNDLSIVHKSKSANKVQMTNEPHNKHTEFDKRSPSDDVLIGSSSSSRRATKETTGGGETVVNTSVAEQICGSVCATNISEHNLSSDYLLSGGGFCLNDEDDTLKVDSFDNASCADGAFAAPLEANLESSDTVQCTTMEESSNEDQSKSSAAAEERISAPNKLSVNREDSKEENELSSLSAMPSLRRKGRKS